MQLLAWLRSLGNAGAVANARQQLDQRRTEAWLVATLSRRLDLEVPAERPSTASVA